MRLMVRRALISGWLAPTRCGALLRRHERENLAFLTCCYQSATLLT
jgi:hypothetical protein